MFWGVIILYVMNMVNILFLSMIMLGRIVQEESRWNLKKESFPDSNPIQSMYDFFITAIHGRINLPQTAKELTVASVEEGNCFSNEVINYLIVSMHRYVNGLVKTNEDIFILDITFSSFLYLMAFFVSWFIYKFQY